MVLPMKSAALIKWVLSFRDRTLDLNDTHLPDAVELLSHACARSRCTFVDCQTMASAEIEELDQLGARLHCEHPLKSIGVAGPMLSTPIIPLAIPTSSDAYRARLLVVRSCFYDSSDDVPAKNGACYASRKKSIGQQEASRKQ